MENNELQRLQEKLLQVERENQEIKNENKEIKREKTALKRRLEEAESKIVKKKLRVITSRPDKIPKRTFPMKRFDKFMSHQPQLTDKLKRGLLLAKLNCLSTDICESSGFYMSSLPIKPITILTRTDSSNNNNLQWVYKIFALSSRSWFRGHLKLEDNLKSKLWDLIFETLFLKYQDSEVSIDHEFNLQWISSYKHKAFADYASVLWSRKQSAYLIFLGEVAAEPTSPEQMHKDFVKLAIELSASLLAIAGHFRNNTSVLEKLRVFGALIGGSSIEICTAYLDFDLQDPDRRRYSVIFRSSSEFLKFDLFDRQSISKHDHAPRFADFLVIADHDATDADTSSSDSMQSQSQPQPQAQPQPQPQSSQLKPQPRLLLPRSSSSSSGKDLNYYYMEESEDSDEMEINEEDQRSDGIKYTLSLYNQLAKTLNLPVEVVSQLIEGRIDENVATDAFTLSRHLSENIFESGGFSYETINILDGFVKNVTDYGFWLRDLLDSEDNGGNSSSSDHDFNFPAAHDILPRSSARSSHSAKSPDRKISDRVVSEILPSSPCPSSDTETQHEKSNYTITKSSTMIEKEFYSSDSLVFMSIFKPRVFESLVLARENSNRITARYTMEYLCSGWTFLQSGEKRNNILQALKFLLNGFSNLYYIHRSGYVHGDVSCNNMRYSVQDRVWKLIDFEQSMEIEKSAGLIRRGGTKGFRGMSSYDPKLGGTFTPKSDIKSLILTFQYLWPSRIIRRSFFEKDGEFRCLLHKNKIVPLLVELLKELKGQLEFRKNYNWEDFKITVSEAETIINEYGICRWRQDNVREPAS